MSMSESEAIRRLKDHFRVHDDGRPTPYLDEAVSMAISALEEVQQLHAIGTVSEFRELKEKATAKKVRGISLTHEGRVGNCPNCKQFVLERYDIKCPKCKINLDWSEGKE